MVRVKTTAMMYELSDKPYRKSIERIIASTAMQHGDIDEKAFRLLDHLEQHGRRAGEAVRHLERCLQGRKRQDVANWHAYVYTLLRGFDEDAYKEMKAAEARRGRKFSGSEQPRAPTPTRPNFEMNPGATEFVPGRPWPVAPVLSTVPKATVPAPRAAAGAPRSSGRYSVPPPERTPEAVEECPKGKPLGSAEPEATKGPEQEISKEQEAGPAYRRVLTGMVADPRVRTVGVHAVGGALALGAGGGAGGLAAGGALGTACGLLTAPFTLGLSIPVGAALGAGAGLCTGAAAGGTSGLVAGGLLGYWRANRASPAA